MKVLMISLDVSLLSDQPAGDVLVRMADYAKQIEQMDVLVFAGSVEPRTVNDGNLRVEASGSKSKIGQFFKGWRRSRVLAQDKQLITCQDPFFAGLLGYLASRKAAIPLVIDVHGDFFGGGLNF